MKKNISLLLNRCKQMIIVGKNDHHRIQLIEGLLELNLEEERVATVVGGRKAYGNGMKEKGSKKNEAKVRVLNKDVFFSDAREYYAEARLLAVWVALIEDLQRGDLKKAMLIFDEGVLDKLKWSLRFLNGLKEVLKMAKEVDLLIISFFESYETLDENPIARLIHEHCECSLETRKLESMLGLRRFKRNALVFYTDDQVKCQ